MISYARNHTVATINNKTLIALLIRDMALLQYDKIYLIIELPNLINASWSHSIVN